MASSARKPDFSRRFLWLSAGIVLVLIAYAAGWFVLAGRLEQTALEMLAKADRDGRRLDCANMTVRGFPFRMGVFCDGVRYEDAGRAVSASVAGFRSAAQVYDPFHIVAELDGPAGVSAPNLGELGLTWRNLRASTRLETDRPRRVSIETDELSATGSAGGQAKAPLMAVGHAEGHMRVNGADLDLATSFSDAKLDAGLTGGATIPPLAGQADLTLADSADLAASGRIDLRGRSGTIRTLALWLADNAGLTLSGPFSVSPEGILDADFLLTVRNPATIARELAAAFPAESDRLRTAFAGLAALGNAPTVPLRIRDGAATLGFIRLGRIPPLPAP